MNGKIINKEEIKTETARIYHPFGPLYNENSKVLILGSFPSVKSREQEFFYGHPQNRFWKVIAGLFPEVMHEIKGERFDAMTVRGEEGVSSLAMTGRSASSIHNAGTASERDSFNTEHQRRAKSMRAASRKSANELLSNDYKSSETIDEKKKLILRSGLALWDSIASCEITGSSDASIRNAEPNDLREITDSCDIRAIYCNGKKSLEVYNRYILPVLGREASALPSTSPANAAWSLERLIEAWAVIKENM